MAGSELIPERLCYSDTIEKGGEFLSIFGSIDILGSCTEYVYSCLLEFHREIIRYLSTHRDDHS